MAFKTRRYNGNFMRKNDTESKGTNGTVLGKSIKQSMCFTISTFPFFCLIFQTNLLQLPLHLTHTYTCLFACIRIHLATALKKYEHTG